MKSRRVEKRQVKGRKKTAKKFLVKPKFATALNRLKQMKVGKQRSAAFGASNEFIRDISGFMVKIRKRPELLTARHRKVLKKHSKNLRKLIHAKTPIEGKRLILSQTGGILPALIPIICAAIGAGGAVAGAATSAAIIKS